MVKLVSGISTKNPDLLNGSFISECEGRQISQFFSVEFVCQKRSKKFLYTGPFFYTGRKDAGRKVQEVYLEIDF
ncbi:hypothetical protein MSMTP_0926 [Methanosarcina sp. MTP4]|uniref:hypothetical protein n=1 Tax=Methanosarcina sp. MTP4 TaxID=1434100 RepID=UPI0006157420|nr:hypothetical protein [Methanosarcina sp. MTP4]AKB24395.1 hypothetical protein MSMTP_0926 [Methanosarcina sp. MTP4]